MSHTLRLCLFMLKMRFLFKNKIFIIPLLLKYFLEKGADVNIRDFQGNTPLFVANFAANKEVTDLLLKFGADPTIRNNKGILYKDFKTGELYIFN